jgi:hypothetical protein
VVVATGEGRRVVVVVGGKVAGKGVKGVGRLTASVRDCGGSFDATRQRRKLEPL